VEQVVAQVVANTPQARAVAETKEQVVCVNCSCCETSGTHNAKSGELTVWCTQSWCSDVRADPTCASYHQTADEAAFWAPCVFQLSGCGIVGAAAVQVKLCVCVCGMSHVVGVLLMSTIPNAKVLA
jgi:hypothetical protein